MTKGFLANLGADIAMSPNGRSLFKLPAELRDPKDPETNWFMDFGKWIIYKFSAELKGEHGYVDLDAHWKALTTKQIAEMSSDIGSTYYGESQADIDALAKNIKAWQTTYPTPYMKNRGYAGVAYIKSVDKEGKDSKKPLEDTYIFSDVVKKSKDTEKDGKKVEGKPFNGGAWKVTFNLCTFYDQVLGSGIKEGKFGYQKYAPFILPSEIVTYLGRIHVSQVEANEFNPQEDVFFISPELKYSEKNNFKNIDGFLNDLWC